MLLWLEEEGRFGSALRGSIHASARKKSPTNHCTPLAALPGSPPLHNACTYAPVCRRGFHPSRVSVARYLDDPCLAVPGVAQAARAGYQVPYPWKGPSLEQPQEPTHPHPSNNTRPLHSCVETFLHVFKTPAGQARGRIGIDYSSSSSDNLGCNAAKPIGIESNSAGADIFSSLLYLYCCKWDIFLSKPSLFRIALLSSYQGGGVLWPKHMHPSHQFPVCAGTPGARASVAFV